MSDTLQAVNSGKARSFKEQVMARDPREWVWMLAETIPESDYRMRAWCARAIWFAYDEWRLPGWDLTPLREIAFETHDISGMEEAEREAWLAKLGLDGFCGRRGS